jgi:antitoxin (DNA-binding transcriptional repressor) of toxin-antitoxin stability system
METKESVLGIPDACVTMPSSGNAETPLAGSMTFRPVSREDDMAITVTIEEAQANLKELLHQLSPGEEIIITEQHKAVARLRGELEKPVRRPPPGLGKGSIPHMSADFDEPLDEMAEYLS